MSQLVLSESKNAAAQVDRLPGMGSSGALGKAIPHRFAISCGFNQSGFPKNFEMVREKGLFDLEFFVDLSNMERPGH